MFHEHASLKYVQGEQVKGVAPLLPFFPILLRGCWAKCRRKEGEVQPHKQSIYNISQVAPS